MRYVLPKYAKAASMENEDCSFAYYSRNPAMRWVFLLRLRQAAALIPDKFKPEGDILDIGTGCGFMLPTLSKISKKAKIVAFDYNNKYLKKAREIGKLNNISASYIKGNVCRLPFENKRFSLVTAISVLEHIESLDNAAREIRRVMRDDGKLIVGIPIERLLVNTLFSLLAMKDRILEGGLNKKNFRKNKYQDVHCSDIREIEAALSRHFEIEKSRKIFLNHIPDAFSLYKVYRCVPKRV